MNNCWILCMPRTGSSYLCELLNNTNIFPFYEDDRLKDNIGPIQRHRAFNEWFRIFSNYEELIKNPPSCCKVIYHQYIETMSGVPFNERRKTSVEYANINPNNEHFVINNYKLDKIQNLFNNKIKFIYLKRDLFEQSVSTYFSRETLQYHIYTQEKLNKYLNQKIEINFKKLINIYFELFQIKDHWEKLFNNTNFIEITYQELINSPNQTLHKIFQYLEIKILPEAIDQSIRTTDVNKRIYKMTRPESYETLIQLKKRLIHLL